MADFDMKSGRIRPAPVIRDIGRKIAGKGRLEEAFARELMLARRVHVQNKNLRPVKGAPEETDLRVFSHHAPEVECIGKGKAHRPYEFGVKVSVAPKQSTAWAAIISPAGSAMPSTPSSPPSATTSGASWRG